MYIYLLHLKFNITIHAKLCYVRELHGKILFFAKMECFSFDHVIAQHVCQKI